MGKQVIIIFGPPGAGKGTQSELLSEKIGLYLFETSKFLEKAFKQPGGIAEFGGQKFDMEKEKKLWESGELNSPPFVAALVQDKIKELHKNGENLIFSGSPRTVYEAERVIPLLKELYGKQNIRIFLLEIKPEETVFRNSHRKICELMRHSILFNKETENLTVCPIDGSKLVRREGLDDSETIKVRLKEYAQRTCPIFDFLEKDGLKVNKVNGEQNVADVFNDILNVLND